MSFTNHECACTTPPGVDGTEPGEGIKGPRSRAEKSRWNIRTWDIWRLPIPAVVHVVTVEVLALLATGWYVTQPREIGLRELIAAVATGLCATLHLYYSRFNEGDRRHFNRQRETGPHIDFVSVWILPAALLLQPALFVAVVLWIRVHRYVLAPRPTHRYVFSTASIVLGGFAAGLAYRQIAVATVWAAPDSAAESLRQTAAVLAAVLTYGGVQMLLVAAAGALSTPRRGRDPRALFGSKAANQLDALVLGMGTVAAIAAAHLPLLIISLVPFAIKANRLAWLEQLVRSERELREGNQILEQRARELATHARTDPLTGVLNLRGFQTRSAEVFGGHTVVAGIAVDLDFFKQVNDTWGHGVGDEALRATACVLLEQVRENDVVARVGGEEFMILLPDRDLAEAAAVAEHIRLGIGAITLRVIDAGRTHTVTPVTASVGVGVYPHDGHTPTELIRVVDLAVYAAKRAGRNQVAVAAHRPEPTRGRHAQPSASNSA
jgi:diguanylate cyclase (GGDEF)-like protein